MYKIKSSHLFNKNTTGSLSSVYISDTSQLSESTTTVSGIVKPLRQRISDLEEINKEHQKINGKLQQEVNDKNKKIEELMEKINNPLKKMRGDGDL